jgi:hypothetical protein
MFTVYLWKNSLFDPRVFSKNRLSPRLKALHTPSTPKINSRHLFPFFLTINGCKKSFFIKLMISCAQMLRSNTPPNAFSLSSVDEISAADYDLLRP